MWPMSSPVGFQPEFNERKFKNLVLYIAQRWVDDKTFGKTSLYKTLWLSDFLAFATLGEPISGATYVHMTFGPGPDGGDEILDEMVEARQLAILSEPAFQYTRLRPVALIDPELEGVFGPSEIALVDDVLRVLAGWTASELSNMSHRLSAGWRQTEDGDVIPYETILLAPDDPTGADLEQASRVIAEFQARA